MYNSLVTKYLTTLLQKATDNRTLNKVYKSSNIVCDRHKKFKINKLWFLSLLFIAQRI